MFHEFIGITIGAGISFLITKDPRVFVLGIVAIIVFMMIDCFYRIINKEW